MDLYVIQDFFEDLFSKKSVRYVTLAMAIIALGVGAVALYQYFVRKNAQTAHQAFSQALAEYEKNIQKTASNQQWDEIVRTFQAGYDRYHKTPIGPYFLAYGAQAQLHNNKPDDALNTMTSFMKDMKTTSPLYYLYATKLALMKIDAASESLRKEGIEALTALAHDRSNLQRDWALYYLGFYFFNHGNKEEAQKLWSTLITQFGTTSEWAALAEQKLEAMKKAAISTK